MHHFEQRHHLDPIVVTECSSAIPDIAAQAYVNLSRPYIPIHAIIPDCFPSPILEPPVVPTIDIGTAERTEIARNPFDGRPMALTTLDDDQLEQVKFMPSSTFHKGATIDRNPDGSYTLSDEKGKHHLRSVSYDQQNGVVSITGDDNVTWEITPEGHKRIHREAPPPPPYVPPKAC